MTCGRDLSSRLSNDPPAIMREWLTSRGSSATTSVAREVVLRRFLLTRVEGTS